MFTALDFRDLILRVLNKAYTVLFLSNILYITLPFYVSAVLVCARKMDNRYIMNF